MIYVGILSSQAETDLKCQEKKLTKQEDLTAKGSIENHTTPPATLSKQMGCCNKELYLRSILTIAHTVMSVSVFKVTEHMIKDAKGNEQSNQQE